MRVLALILIMCSLLGCDDDARAPEATVQPTVLDDQMEAMAKAKAVEAKNLEQKRKLDEQLDSGG